MYGEIDRLVVNRSDFDRSFVRFGRSLVCSDCLHLIDWIAIDLYLVRGRRSKEDKSPRVWLTTLKSTIKGKLLVVAVLLSIKTMRYDSWARNLSDRLYIA